MENLNSETLLKLFTQFAMKEGSSNLLSLDGLKNLLQSDSLNFLLQGPISLSEITKYVDLDKDGKVTFNDFKTLISKLRGLSNLASGVSSLVS